MSEHNNTSNADDEQDDEVIASAVKRSGIVIVAIAFVGVCIFGIVQLLKPLPEEDKRTEIVLPEDRAVDQLTVPALPLTDITDSSGIDWAHESGRDGEKLLPETMGGGVAVFDYDRDGDQDLLFVGGQDWDWTKTRNPKPRSLCLLANDGKANFKDVTQKAGLGISLYGMSPVVGDFDNDGWADLYVTAVGKNLLFRNDSGVFRDVTESSRAAGKATDWSTGGVFLDYDKDGRLDLFVANYVVWNRELDLSLGFSLVGVGRAYGQPTAFTGTQSMLLHNEGDGSFKDVTKTMGIEVTNSNTGVPVGKGLAVAAVDVDDDGWTDILVSNDTVQNFLYLNIDGKVFEESGVPMGVAFDRSGNSTGAMGVDCGFLRNDASLAVGIGNFANEQSSLYVSDSPMAPFTDQAMATGIGPLSRLNLTFGMCFADLDLDSRQDIFCSNGHLEAEISKVQSTQQYAQPPQFFWNAGTQGSSEFVPLKEVQVGKQALERMVGRGAAYGDLDSDGDLDIVLVASGSKPRVLRNDQELGNHWLRLQLTGSSKSNTSAYGARLEVTAGGVVQTRIISPTRSYLSQCETIATFGLGSNETVTRVKILWPDGTQEILESIDVDQTLQITQASNNTE